MKDVITFSESGFFMIPRREIGKGAYDLAHICKFRVQLSDILTCLAPWGRLKGTSFPVPYPFSSPLAFQLLAKERPLNLLRFGRITSRKALAFDLIAFSGNFS